MFCFPGSVYASLYEVWGAIAALALCVAVALEVKDKRNKTFFFYSEVKNPFDFFLFIAELLR